MIHKRWRSCRRTHSFITILFRCVLTSVSTRHPNGFLHFLAATAPTCLRASSTVHVRRELVFLQDSDDQDIPVDDHQHEFKQLLEATRTTERKVEEISQLNHLFTTTILQQQAQIETVYNNVVEASKNIKGGNKELTKTIEYRRGSMKMIIVLMTVITLMMLFLDRYF